MRIYIALILLFTLEIVKSQHSIKLSKDSYSLVIDNLSDLSNNRTILGITTVQLETDFQALGDLFDENWDLHVSQTLSSVPYTTDGTPFSAQQLGLKASNFCDSPNPLVITPGWTGTAERITSTSFTQIPNATPYYILGSEAQDSDKTANCPLATDLVNNDGSYLTSPQSHSFRIDAQLDFSEFYTNGGTIQPGKYVFNLSFELARDNVGTIATETFVLELEILPILQLNLLSSDQITFDFSDISKYNGGITKIAKTILEVSSNVNWDLYPVGTSLRNENGAGEYYWDTYAQYGSIGTTDIPLTALQIQQAPVNPVLKSGAVADVLDYSSSFVTPMTVNDTNNNIFVSSGYLPLVNEGIFGNSFFRAIAGSIDKDGFSHRVGPGSYLLPNPSISFDQSDYRYIISYRIVPGVPTLFIGSKPTNAMGGDNSSSGAFSMQVRYILKSDL